MNKIQNSIILGAFLHDLEKKFAGENFLEKSGFFDAVKNAPDIDIKILEECLLTKSEQNNYFKIISLANKFQSGNGIIEENKAAIKLGEELVNLLPNISIKEDKTRQDKEKIPLQKLVYSNLKGIFEEKSDYDEKYKEEYKGEFEKEFKEIINPKNLPFDVLLSFFILVLQKYLWCQPANPEDEVSDISLWEHSALTSAISNCLYLYVLNKDGKIDEEKLKKIEEETKELSDLRKEKIEKPFRLVIGDFSGIQEYIFNIQKMKTAAKRLKGRSFLVQMISEDIKNYILEELGLCPLNTIICAGGKFAILAPNTNKIQEDFKKVKKEVEERIFKRFKGEIRFNLALSKHFKGDEFGEIKPNVGNFGKYYDDVFIEVAKNKYHPFEKILKLKKDDKWDEWNEKKFIIEDKDRNNQEKIRDELTLCKLCKKYLIDSRYNKTAKTIKEDDNGICQNCGEEIELGKMLKKENKYIIWKEKSEEPNDKEATLLFSNIKLTSDTGELKNGGFVTIINPDEESIKSIVDKNARAEARFFSTFVPFYESGKVTGSINIPAEKIEIKSFDDILKDELENRDGKGFRKLGILKGDMDNLGKIFYFGLKNYKNLEDNSYTATRLKTLSSYINLFFEGYIDWLAKNDERFNNLYIVFAGGDDFTIVGYWETLIDFVLKLREDFEKLACKNEEVHFSAAIHLMDHKWAIYDEIKKAEEELKEAKDFDEKEKKKENRKNKVYIFGKVLEWKELAGEKDKKDNDFKGTKELADEFQKFIDEGVSMGYLWKLHKISKMIYDYIEKDELLKLLSEKKDKLSKEEKEKKNKLLKEKAYSAMWKPYLYYFTERNLGEKAKNWINKKVIKQLGNDKNWKEINIIKNLDIFTTYLLYKNRKS